MRLLSPVFLPKRSRSSGRVRQHSDKSDEKPVEKPSPASEVSSPACHLTNTPKLAYCSESLLRQRRGRSTKAPPAVVPPLLLNTTPEDSSRRCSPAKQQHVDHSCLPDESSNTVFLKCSSSKRHDDENGHQNQTTDLDIQFQQLKIAEGLPKQQQLQPLEDERKSVEAGGGGRSSTGQSLVQYCNFEEKKVVKVAPHIRRKDVICDTVDAWSRQGDSGLLKSGRPRYRPLIFGGTYPIDAPLECDALDGPSISKTFDIDAPTSLLDYQ